VLDAVPFLGPGPRPYLCEDTLFSHASFRIGQRETHTPCPLSLYISLVSVQAAAATPSELAVEFEMVQQTATAPTASKHEIAWMYRIAATRRRPHVPVLFTRAARADARCQDLSVQRDLVGSCWRSFALKKSDAFSFVHANCLLNFRSYPRGSACCWDLAGAPSCASSSYSYTTPPHTHRALLRPPPRSNRTPQRCSIRCHWVEAIGAAK
jgi:hypothetical protein